MIQKANDYFHGNNGTKRVNCAQAVASASKEKFTVDETTIDNFKDFGGGRAPGKLCGALFAAKYVLDTNNPDAVPNLLTDFENKAGSLKCAEIRKLKKLSCAECVKTSAAFLDSL